MSAPVLSRSFIACPSRNVRAICTSFQTYKRTLTRQDSASQSLEPILFPKLRIYFADFPYLHYSIDQRLEVIRERYQILKQGKSKFDDVHGKDEDVVWIQIFRERLDAKADPLAKYSKLSFEKKKKNQGFFQRLANLFK